MYLGLIPKMVYIVASNDPFLQDFLTLCTEISNCKETVLLVVKAFSYLHSE